MKKNRFLSAVLAAAMAASMASTAFADTVAAHDTIDDAIKSAETDAEVTPGGTLIVAMPMAPATLDPLDYSSMYESHIMFQVCDTLIAYDENYRDYIPCLATEWSVSDDGLTYYFTLRDDVYFSNGRKMTAEDVKYSFERISKSANDRLANGFYTGTDVIDDTHIAVHTSSVCGPFLDYIAGVGTIILPKEEVEAAGDQWGLTKLVGTGAFTLEKVVTDESVTLKKNPNYWGAEPLVDEIKFVIMSDTNQMVNAVKTGEVDIAMYLQGESVGEAKKAGLLMTRGASACTYIRFNMQNGPTADPKVREALVKAVDIDALVEGIYQYGEAERLYQPISLYSWGYDPELNNLVPEYDPDEAKKLLKEAGYGKGMTLDMYIGSTTNRNKMAQIIQSYWEEVGVKLNIHSTTMAEWTANVTNSWQSDAVNVYGVSWNSGTDPYGFLQRFFHTRYNGASSNAGGYSNPEMDEKFDVAFASADREFRKGLYIELMKDIMAENTGIYYAAESRCWAVSPKVHGVIVRADNQVLVSTPFTRIWKEQ